MDKMFLPLKRYAEFGGRSARPEYWLFALFSFVVIFALSFLLGGFSADAGTEPGAMSLAVLIPMLALLIPSIAVTVRRFHDQDRSGWFALLGLIPLIGGIILIVMMCLPGTDGDNRFGSKPA